MNLDNRSIFISRNAVFHEHVFPFKTENSLFPDFFSLIVLPLSVPFIADSHDSHDVAPAVISSMHVIHGVYAHSTLLVVSDLNASSQSSDHSNHASSFSYDHSPNVPSSNNSCLRWYFVFSSY